MFATTPWISSRCPATLVRFASSRSHTPAVLLFNASRGLSLSRMRIGVTVPAPLGHLNALTALARRLESRGHEVICIGIPDAASGVAAAGLRFEEYCGKQFPLGSYAERAATLSKLSGDAGFAYTLQWIEDGCRAELAETPGVLRRVGLDGLVVDQIHQGVSPVAMAT